MQVAGWGLWPMLVNLGVELSFRFFCVIVVCIVVVVVVVVVVIVVAFV